MCLVYILSNLLSQRFIFIIKVTHFLKEIAWRFEAIKSIITGKKPLITKETANSSMTNCVFSSEKGLSPL